MCIYNIALNIKMVGKIRGNKVIIDMFDLAEEDHVYVESHKLNLSWNLVIITIIIGIVAVIFNF